MPSLPLIKYTMEAVGASAARALKQAIKPHIPMIKFPKRLPLSQMQAGPVGNPNSLDALITKNVTSGTAPSASKKSSGPSIETSELPVRFRRKLISNEEMEFIEKGGPV